MGMYYNIPPKKPPPWWVEAFVLIRAVFGILFWPMVAIVIVLAALFLTFYLFTVHWALGLLMLGIIGAAIAAFAWWDRNRSRPPVL